MKTKFVHYTYPYKHNSAGLRAIHYFCHLMRACGYDSYITTTGNRDWNTLTHCGRITDKDVVIYPDDMQNKQNTDPLNAKNVVRYMLYFPDAYFGGATIPASEYCMPYHEDYYDECVKHYAGNLTKDDILTLPTIENSLFAPSSIKTINASFFVGKGIANYPSKYLPAKSVRITYSSPPTRLALANLLKKTKVFYSFDHFTVLITEAALCGCDVFC